MSEAVLLTGATGFLGMEVLARLLEAGEHEIVAPVRAPDQAGADARMDQVLATLYRGGGDPELRARVTAVPGDVTEPGLGLGHARHDVLERTGAIVHCAASISFSLPLAEARAINVEGTREVLALARAAPGLERLVHVSTAFVSGRWEGSFREDQLDEGQGFRNTYEQTKWESEHLVGAADDLPTVIARPSIVMGESDSGWTPAFNVLYWPLRAFSRGLIDAVPASEAAQVDVVPVDYVADGIVALLAGREPGVVNLVAGERAPSVGLLIELACAHFDRPRPTVVPPGSAQGTGPADEQGGVYLPYFSMGVTFDDARARALLGPRGIACPPFAAYFDRLMDYADRARWGKRPLTREEAREGLDALAA